MFVPENSRSFWNVIAGFHKTKQAWEAKVRDLID